MNICCTFPGRFGDLLWALPTLRAVAEVAGAPVALWTTAEYGTPSFVDLVSRQPYISAVYADRSWRVQQTAPMTPAQPPGPNPGLTYDRLLHLGYTGWPQHPLPQETYLAADEQLGIALPHLNLATPWITATPQNAPYGRVAGFSDEWFELKYGCFQAVKRNLPTNYTRAETWTVLIKPNSRWRQETEYTSISDWEQAAAKMAGAKIFLGDCSALHVLAVALGVPVVVLEPSPERHHPIFWPLGMDGPQVTCVKGNDGQPTFDARHVADVVKRVGRM